jgi:acetylornithine deacetylase
LYMISQETMMHTQEAIDLLKKLIATPSYSREEDQTALIIQQFFHSKNVPSQILKNNVWAINKHFDDNKPTILLNSHHDTVKPNNAYTIDPFTAYEHNSKLFGLGSNDAGGALVSMIAGFLQFFDIPGLKYNLVLAATAEEEISGSNGIELLLHDETFIRTLGSRGIDCAIVGEPTKMQMAVAERGLMVLDCTSKGKAGHAAREEGENAIYKALEDIRWFSSFQFPAISEMLGPVKMTVTVINTENRAHNIVPAQCSFVVDTRVNELYSFEEILDTVRQHVHSEVQPRSMRLRSSAISLDHVLVKAGLELGRQPYGSPTTSDKALMPFPALKIGPGDSARSHIADEFIYTDEIKEGIEIFVRLLGKVVVSEK